ncbi:alkylhydroperoxidase domain protein [Leucobacter sp. GX24907]
MPLSDTIDVLAGVAAGDSLDTARARRPEAREHAQGSFEALLVPIDASEVLLPERAAVALFVARLHGLPAAVEFYGALLRETGGGAGLEPLIVAEAAAAAGTGPYGRFHGDSAPQPFDAQRDRIEGPVYEVSTVAAAYALGDRLAAALEHAHMLVLHPRDASREHLQRLLESGWSTTGIVTLSQLISFLAFQLRVVQGLGAIGGTETSGRVAEIQALAAETARAATARSGQSEPVSPSAETLPGPPRVSPPPRFTQDALGWKPWLEPLTAADFTERHYEALVERERVHMPYFRLLARDPEALLERTLTDLDIFQNPDAGLGRAERELGATAASRLNGCVFCASVHSAAATRYGADSDDVQRLLDAGVSARFSAAWNALIDATSALTETPPRFGEPEILGLQEAGFDALEMLDAVYAGAFFNWANRLMLSLGEPTT